MRGQRAWVQLGAARSNAQRVRGENVEKNILARRGSLFGASVFANVLLARMRIGGRMFVPAVQERRSTGARRSWTLIPKRISLRVAEGRHDSSRKSVQIRSRNRERSA